MKPTMLTNAKATPNAIAICLSNFIAGLHYPLPIDLTTKYRAANTKTMANRGLMGYSTSYPAYITKTAIRSMMILSAIIDSPTRFPSFDKPSSEILLHLLARRRATGKRIRQGVTRTPISHPPTGNRENWPRNQP